MDSKQNCGADIIIFFTVSKPLLTGCHVTAGQWGEVAQELWGAHGDSFPFDNTLLPLAVQMWGPTQPWTSFGFL